MAESTLSLGYSDYRSEIGYYLGYGRTSGNWTSDQTSDINAILKMGLRQFYYPPVLSKGEPIYDWSFLHINTTIATVADDYDQTLPDGFGGLETEVFTFATTDGAYNPVKVIGESQIRTLRQGNTLTGIQRFAAIRMRSTDGTTGQRFEVIWWPTPDAVYTMGYRYRVQPDNLSDAAPYPYGGMVHAETILASCLAIAEERIKDERGVKWDSFMTKLAQSIAYDRSLGQQYFGYNGDRSDSRDSLSDRSHRYIGNNNVTFNGVEYP